jgi:hypothetical protein
MLSDTEERFSIKFGKLCSFLKGIPEENIKLKINSSDA